MFKSHSIFDGDILFLWIGVIAEIMIKGIMVTPWCAECSASIGSLAFLGNSSSVSTELVHVEFEPFCFHYFPFFLFEIVESLFFYPLAI